MKNYTRTSTGLWMETAFIATIFGLIFCVYSSVTYATVGATELFSSPASLPDLDPGQKDSLNAPTVIRSVLTQVEFDSLAGSDEIIAEGDQGRDEVILNLFDDVSYTAVRKRLERRSATRYTWFGFIEGHEGSQVILVVEDGSVVGNISVAGSNYQIRDIGHGASLPVIMEIDQSAFPDEAEPVAPSGGLPDGRADVPPPGGHWVIDVLVVYTADAASVGNIMADIQLAMSESNASYRDSGIDLELRLVHAAQIEYTETGNIATDLGRLVTSDDDFMDRVHDLRATHRADLTSLWVQNGGGFCGVGRFMNTVSEVFSRQAFSVVEKGCATGNFSFAHEFGHNMGANHDWGVDSSTTPFEFGHGYVYEPGKWRTIMAYNTDCVKQGFSCDRKQFWSNPDRNFDQVPTGVRQGESNPADNRQVLNETAPTVANFSKNQFILTANNRGSVDVRLNHGDGTFDPPIGVGDAQGANFSEFAVADFTGDGELDFIAATDENPSKLYLFKRTSAITFTQSFLGTLDPDSRSTVGLGLIAADLDQDGDIDFIENRHQDFNSNTVAWIAKGNAHLNNGDETFQKIPDAFDFSSIFTGWTLGMSSNVVDVDGDTYPDMLASEQKGGSAVSSKVYLLKGKGDGTFFAPVEIFTTASHPATYMTLGDFDNNGRVDAVVGQDDDGDPGAAFLFKGRGDGTFEQSSVEVIDTRDDIESGSDQPGGGLFLAYDADHDDNIDIVSGAGLFGLTGSQPLDARLLLFRGKGDGTFENPQIILSDLLAPTAFVTPLTRPFSNVVNNLVTLDETAVDTSLDTAPDGMGGIVSAFIITATFTNTSSAPIRRPFFRVVTLESVIGPNNTIKHAVVNADGGIKLRGEGATITPDVGDGVLSPGETMTVDFVIGLFEIKQFVFFVDLLAQP